MKTRTSHHCTKCGWRLGEPLLCHQCFSAIERYVVKCTPMIKLDTRYVRRSPQGEESIIKATNEQEQKYHTGLIAEGYTYTEVVVHVAKEPCPSCEA